MRRSRLIMTAINFASTDRLRGPTLTPEYRRLVSITTSHPSAQIRICLMDIGRRPLLFRTSRCSASDLANEESPGRPRRPVRSESSIPNHVSSVADTCPEFDFGQTVGFVADDQIEIFCSAGLSGRNAVG